MATSSPAAIPRPRPSRLAAIAGLWQVPLLLLAVGLFAFAAYLFIDPHAGPSIDQKFDAARGLLKAERPEAAINALNRIVLAEKLDRDHDGAVHLLLGQALAALQQQKKISLRSYHEQIVEQTTMAESLGVKPTYDIERRLGESYEAMGRQAKALDHYRQAAAMDPTHALRLQRKVIELQLATGDVGPADQSLERYAADPELSDGERAWALCNRAKLMVDRGEYVRGRDLLDRAATLDADAGTAGQVTYYRGYCAAKTGDAAGAEALLRQARQQLRSDNPLDADAACLLGQLAADHNDPRTAASFFNEVVVNHPDSSLVPTALLGRGLARLATGQGADDRGQADLADVTRRAAAAEPASPTFNAAVVAGLSQGAATLSARGNPAAALELLDDERLLVTKHPADFYHQLSAVFEQQADQLERPTPGDGKRASAEVAKKARDFRVNAGDASVAEAHALTLADDKGYGVALWRAVDLYERAGDAPGAIDGLTLFATERPSDPLAPKALLRLGQAYRSAGQLDKAIAAYQRAQFLYPNSLAASQSAVPLAQAYLARGPADFGRAEAVLRGVIEGNPILTPEADEYRQALFELGRLYYRTDRYELAIARLTDWTTRYGDDERMGQALFLSADSYRKSAARLAADPSATTRPADAAEVAAVRRGRLDEAKAGYDAVVTRYGAVPPKAEVDRVYDRLAHFYRADCLYDTGRYAEAIRQYDAAAFRYADDPASLAAYVQIVNAYYALGKPDEARAANERAKVLLNGIPAESFSSSMPKAYWENQFRFTSGSGMW